MFYCEHPPPARISSSRPDNPGRNRSFLSRKGIARQLDLSCRLLADSKFLNYGAILGNVLLLQILQKPSPLADELQ